MLWYHNTKTVVAEFKNDFICSYTRDFFIGIKKYQNFFSKALESRVFASTFFNISVNNWHFSVDLSLDFIFTVASIINEVCTLKQLGLQRQKAQKHIYCAVSHACANQLCRKFTKLCPERGGCPRQDVLITLGRWCGGRGGWVSRCDCVVH